MTQICSTELFHLDFNFPNKLTKISKYPKGRLFLTESKIFYVEYVKKEKITILLVKLGAVPELS